jgi:hypothetical protein
MLGALVVGITSPHVEIFRMICALRIVVVLFSMFVAAPTMASACGSERWSAKVLADGTSLFGQPAIVDVNYLRSLPRPQDVDGFNARRVAAERRIYEVRGELLGFKIEDDGDIHAIIAESSDRSATLVAEIPDPGCMAGAPSTYVRDVVQTRLAFVKRYGIPPYRSMRLAYQPITVLGPAFFDFEHGQVGSAPNDIEVHPVLGLGSFSNTASGSTAAMHKASSPPNTNTSCGTDTVVWVNLNSAIYHLPGTRWYGTTKYGMYMCRRTAETRGYRAAHNE